MPEVAMLAIAVSGILGLIADMNCVSVMRSGAFGTTLLFVAGNTMATRRAIKEKRNEKDLMLANFCYRHRAYNLSIWVCCPP